MQPFLAAGVTYFMLTVLGLPNPEITGLLTEEILPKLTK
jgi:hypothetical protein